MRRRVGQRPPDHGKVASFSRVPGPSPGNSGHDPGQDRPNSAEILGIGAIAPRDGEKTIGLLTNLPETVSAVAIAEIYRKRWTIETQFQLLTVSLHCEVPGLGKPKAALFAFAMSLVASNALAVVRGSLRAAHGKEAEAEVSGYYLADEVAAEYRTLAKYLGAETWVEWRKLGAKEMVSLLTEIARQVNMAELLRNERGPKKPPDKKPVYNRKHKHFSTYRLIEEDENPC